MARRNAKHSPVLPHMCNEPIRCPCCTHRFWVWAEAWTNGRKGAEGPSFYEAARKEGTS